MIFVRANLLGNTFFFISTKCVFFFVFLASQNGFKHYRHIRQFIQFRQSSVITLLSQRNHTETLGFSRISACTRHKDSQAAAETLRVSPLSSAAEYQPEGLLGRRGPSAYCYMSCTQAKEHQQLDEKHGITARAPSFGACFQSPQCDLHHKKKKKKHFAHKLTFSLKNTKYCSTGNLQSLFSPTPRQHDPH